MSAETKKRVLFIKDRNSSMDAETKKFDELFEQVDIAFSGEEAVPMLYRTKYDIVIGDLSVETHGLATLKQINEMRKETVVFALVSPKDSEKLYKISELGINAFELLPEQFDLALETIADFSPAS